MGDPGEHPNPRGGIFHSRRVGGLGVAVEFLADGDAAPIVAVANVSPFTDGDLSPVQARQLAADLLAAADLLDGVNGAALLLGDGCPMWCTASVADHADEDGVRIHRRTVGDLGVAIEWTEGDPVIDGPSVYVPELDADKLHASPAFACQLAADMLAAVGVLNAVAGA